MKAHFVSYLRPVKCKILKVESIDLTFQFYRNIKIPRGHFNINVSFFFSAQSLNKR